jgi:hypothetical protein
MTPPGATRRSTPVKSSVKLGVAHLAVVGRVAVFTAGRHGCSSRLVKTPTAKL